jgi:vitamin K-dependent gamma-carboxylase
LFDPTIARWLLAPRTRPFAYAAVIGFHVLTRVLFPIGMFPAIMIASALVFFSPSWPRSLGRVWLRVRRRPPVQLPAHDAAAPAKRQADAAHARWPIVLGISYCLFQLALPLRHLYYGGNVLWHEQGMRFSWRVMVRAKGGDTTFVVRDPSRNRTFHLSPRTYLTDTQESEMSSQPDLILQLAHHIQKDLRQHGRSGDAVEVYVDSRVSLNGRRSQPMIDPTVDLTKVRDGLAPAHWILPTPEQSPPHTRPVL